ncbi:MAG: alginate lyase family protein, partial [Rhodospirillaceae bacterium]|nr:alginate lyase family protein [Rhodospirillaceae bacterium]
AWPYISNLVVQYRGIALGWAWLFIAGLPDDIADEKREIEFLILKILQEDVRYLSNRTGDSHPNNHLLADGFIGWLLATTFPEFSVSSMLLERSNAVIETELARQTYDDGTSFEHSVHYHEMGCEMVAAHILICRCNGIEPGNGNPERFAKMLRFQAAMGGVEGTPLPVGDATEDPLFPLDAGHGWGTGALRELYRTLFEPAMEPTHPDNPAIERAFWLLAGDLADPPSQCMPAKNFQAFEQGGFYVFSDAKRDSRMIFRTGPAADVELMAGHMHADILSICFSQSGSPVIVDPGTYSYRSDPGKWPENTSAWRYHFMGPSAHSGLVISDEDPLSELLGDFRDSKTSTRVKQTRCHSSGSLSWAEGMNVGDTLYAGHRRGGFHVQGAYWLVYDFIPPGLEGREVNLGLQFSADTEVDIAHDRMAVATTKEQILNLAWNEGLEMGALIKGSINPTSGWVAPRYGVVDPAPYLRFDIHRSVVPAAIVYSAGQRAGAALSLKTLSLDNGGFGFAVSTGEGVDYLLWQAGERATLSSTCGISFEAECLWLRTQNNIPTELRWIGGKHLAWEKAGLEVSAPEIIDGISVRFSVSGDHAVESSGPVPAIRLDGLRA